MKCDFGVCSFCGEKVAIQDGKLLPHYRIISNVSAMSVAALESGAAEEAVLCKGDVAEWQTHICTG